MIAKNNEAELVLIESLDPEPEKLRCLIEETLAQDPRPGYERGKDGREGQRWNMQVSHYSIFWTVKNGVAEVVKLERVER